MNQGSAEDLKRKFLEDILASLKNSIIDDDILFCIGLYETQLKELN